MVITRGLEWVVSAWWVSALGVSMWIGVGLSCSWVGVGFSFGLLDFRVVVVGFDVSTWWVSTLGRIGVDRSKSFLLVGWSGFRFWVAGFSGCCGFTLWWLWVCIILL